METKINELMEIRCCPDETTVLLCDVLSMLKTESCCSNCPLIEFARRYENEIYGDAMC